MKSRILVALIGVPILLYLVLYAPPMILLLALFLLAGIGGLELQRCVSGEKWNFLILISMIFSAWSVYWYDKFFERPVILSAALGIYILILFFYAICKGGEIKFQQITAALFSVIFIGYSFAAFLRMEASGIPRIYLLLPFILSFACDTCAYFSGLTLGKHKLAPKVSPKKTIEGSIGGLIGNILFGLLFASMINHWFNGNIESEIIGTGPMILLSLVCGVTAQIGDLSFSLIKREFGIKDYGHIFLEHGGVLDRFDSVLFVTPVVEIVLNLVR